MAITGFVHALVESLCLSPVSLSISGIYLWKHVRPLLPLQSFWNTFCTFSLYEYFTSSSYILICPISFTFSTRFSFLAVFPNKSMLSKIFFRVQLQQPQVLSDALHRFFEISLIAYILFLFHANCASHNASRTISYNFSHVLNWPITRVLIVPVVNQSHT